MLSQWFQPEPFFKGLPLAKAFRARGHEVEVLTGFPNYPGGKVYRGYRIAPCCRETIDGVRVNRVALYPSHDRSGTRRIVNYLSFAASAAFLGPLIVRRPHVVYVFNLLTLGIAARVLRQLRGAGIVLDVQDLWPDSVEASGMLRNRMLISVLRSWCLAEYRRPDRIVVLSPGFKHELAARGVSPTKIDVIYNWCDESAIVVPAHNNPQIPADARPDGFTVVFAGTMGVMQGLDVLIDAAMRIREIAPDVSFLMVGGGVEVPRLMNRASGLPNVRFLPAMPMSQIGSVFAVADAMLVHLKDDPLFRITIPSKIQAYMYAGKPILCGLRGEGAELVSRAEAGISFSPGDPDSLVSAVLRLRRLPTEERRRMGERGRAYYQKHLAFDIGVRRLEQVLVRAANSRRAPIGEVSPSTQAG